MSRVFLAVAAGVPCALLLAPAYAVALVLRLTASLIRGVGAWLEPRHVPWPALIGFDPLLGWKPRPGLDTSYLADGDDVFRVITDREGWPGRRALDDSDVVVLGDSFAFGYGVDSARSFAEVAGLRVKAVGAPGYSMVHGVLLLEQFAERLRGRLVVWLVYLENDLQDNLAPEMRGYRAPFARCGRDGGWGIEAGHVSASRWESSNLDARRLFPYLCVPGPLADRAYAACDYLLERAQAQCRAVGARLVVVTVPHPMQLTADGAAQLAAGSGAPQACDVALPDRRIAGTCGRLGVPMVAGRDVLSRGDYKRREGIHWNPRGHRRIAALLRGLYASHSAGTLTSPPHAVGAPGLTVPNTLLRSQS